MSTSQKPTEMMKSTYLNDILDRLDVAAGEVGVGEETESVHCRLVVGQHVALCSERSALDLETQQPSSWAVVVIGQGQCKVECDLQPFRKSAPVWFSQSSTAHAFLMASRKCSKPS